MKLLLTGDATGAVQACGSPPRADLRMDAVRGLGGGERIEESLRAGPLGTTGHQVQGFRNGLRCPTITPRTRPITISRDPFRQFMKTKGDSGWINVDSMR